MLLSTCCKRQLREGCVQGQQLKEGFCIEPVTQKVVRRASNSESCVQVVQRASNSEKVVRRASSLENVVHRASDSEGFVQGQQLKEGCV